MRKEKEGQKGEQSERVTRVKRENLLRKVQRLPKKDETVRTGTEEQTKRTIRERERERERERAISERENDQRERDVEPQLTAFICAVQGVCSKFKG